MEIAWHFGISFWLGSVAAGGNFGRVESFVGGLSDVAVDPWRLCGPVATATNASNKRKLRKIQTQMLFLNHVLKKKKSELGLLPMLWECVFTNLKLGKLIHNEV